MIDQSESVYYFTYVVICLALGLAYIRSRSKEGTVITTKEFQIFQTSFVTGYVLVIFSELVASASFYHTLIALGVTLEKITKLYLVTVVSSTLGNIALEIVDIGSKKDKCVICALLYSISMFSLFFGGHYEMLLMGRIAYGFASSIQHTCFEAYAVHEHSSRGFPEDWLFHTFSWLTHMMALVAALTGIVGQISASFGTLGCITLCCVLFAIAAIYMMVMWEKDVNSPRFMLSGFLFNFSHTLSTIRSNRQLQVLIMISSLCETSIIVFTFYWAPWIATMLDEEDRQVPFEIIFSTLVAASMVGNYLFQILTSNSGFSTEQIFQAILISSSVFYFLGAIFQTPLFAFLVSLAVQGSVGLYWPCIGYFRGKIVVPEQRNTALIIAKYVQSDMYLYPVLTFFFLFCIEL